MKFIRKNGRIIPIRDENSYHNLKGAALIGAGLAVSRVSGGIAAKTLHSAALHDNTGQKLRKLFYLQTKGGINKEAINTGRSALLHAVKGRELEKEARVVYHSGANIGAALVGTGVHKALQNQNMPEKKKLAISAGAGIAAHFAIRSKFMSGVGVRGFDVLKKAVQYAVKEGPKKGLKLTRI